MNSPTELKHSKLTSKVIGTFYEVYNELGHGFIESVYEKSLAIALRENGHEVFQQVDIPVWFRGNQVGDFDADLLVDRTPHPRIEVGPSDRARSRRAVTELFAGYRR